MGKNIYILSCTSNKKEGRHPVKELYTGQLFQKGLAYAKRHGADIILVIGGECKSNIYGLDDEIESYDGLIIGDLHIVHRIKLAKQRLKNIIAKGCNIEKGHFVFLTGQFYYEFILAGRPNALSNAIVNYETPFSEYHLKGIGEILHFLENN